jgi:hypothetical protein
VILVSAGVIIALGVLMVLFVQQLEQKAGGGTPFGISSGGLKVEPEPVEISGRTFRSMGGMWVESDLTVAEVAGARAIDRAVLLATRDLSRETLEILGRFQRRITLQVGGEVLRVTARRAGARRSGRVPG